MELLPQRSLAIALPKGDLFLRFMFLIGTFSPFPPFGRERRSLGLAVFRGLNVQERGSLIKKFCTSFRKKEEPKKSIIICPFRKAERCKGRVPAKKVLPGGAEGGISFARSCHEG